ncbi:spermatogenesis-associated protein 20 [Nannizzia gypsea CBS 118893]|uniref:Spermatogenesis-associated protein 20 n=1 Tax=Arthroderma gypseum (strain ATCC MYA-4604 / CBS 118893) TaxID=535722 RepID=E4UT74_ARTGP|nr:spermatogenesis-associated protein 20 [Nannizzia gypsea CBS 118893]EFR01470.1 spermatogenesis-associated protein 20 [Nannizzia gypsea CBS 118893]
MDTATHRKRIDESAGSPASAELVNRLSESRSPYVRSHMNNPVAWQLWDSTAINKAKQLNRLIFLSIGYSACHWCHVMEKESFMSAEVATILNKSFIPIKLDREERPDIDDVYMNYVQATTGSGGWPLNVFLTPDLEPVFGGTYWPGPNATPLPKLGGEEPVGFVDVLEKLRDVWNTQQLRCRESAKEITRQLREFAEEGIHLSQANKSEQEEDLEVDLLEEAYTHFAARYDATNGGFSGSPKFPTPVNLSFLLRLSRYPEEKTQTAAQPEDTEKREGAYYILGHRDADVCARHWGVLPDGNVARVNDPHDEFMNRNVLRIATTPAQVAKEFGLHEEETIRILKSSRVKLREYRETKRVRPELDDKVIVAWNGLVIGALAKCAILLEDIDEEKSKHCKLMASNAVKFIKENLFDAESGQLWRIYRADSRGNTPGFADDYAYLISGLLQLYEATFDDAHLQFADKLQQYLNKYFISVSASDSSICTGFYMTPSEAVTDTPGALFRLKTGTDSATPSTNGVIAQNLLRLSTLLEDESYKLKARQTCHAFAVEIMQHPFLFVGMLDVIVGLEIGTKSVTGVLGRATATGEDRVKAERDLIRRIRTEAGRTASTSAAVLSMVDVRATKSDPDRSRTDTSSWLRGRNSLFKELSSAKGKDFLLICEAGSCRTVDVV